MLFVLLIYNPNYHTHVCQTTQLVTIPVKVLTIFCSFDYSKRKKWPKILLRRYLFELDWSFKIAFYRQFWAFCNYLKLTGVYTQPYICILRLTLLLKNIRETRVFFPVMMVLNFDTTTWFDLFNFFLKLLFF